MLSSEQLHEKLIEAGKHVHVGRRHRHYKGGEYTVLYLAFEESTMEIVVVYQPEYGEHRVVFTRPLAVWSELVEWQGATIPRFTQIEEQ